MQIPIHEYLAPFPGVAEALREGISPRALGEALREAPDRSEILAKLGVRERSGAPLLREAP